MTIEIQALNGIFSQLNGHGCLSQDFPDDRIVPLTTASTLTIGALSIIVPAQFPLRAQNMLQAIEKILSYYQRTGINVVIEIPRTLAPALVGIAGQNAQAPIRWPQLCQHVIGNVQQYL